MSTPATEHQAPGVVVAAAASGWGPSRLLVLRPRPALVLAAFVPRPPRRPPEDTP